MKAGPTMKLGLLTPETAPEASRPLLEGVQKKYGGFLPNLYQQMAHSPAILEAYLTLSDIFAKTDFTGAEQQLILLTASARNGCTYCVAAHSSGGRMAGLDKQAIEAVRNGEMIEDARLQALRQFTEQQMEARGKTGAQAVSVFVAAGFSEILAAEVLVGISMKALSNSFARMMDTPLEGIMAKMEWAGNDRV